jgi:hypothetical protein
LGAFEGGRLVGFITNGKEKWEGMNAGCDRGMGVLPEARGSGLSAELVARLVDLPGGGRLVGQCEIAGEFGTR